ncbi:unnamed protein product, partial [Vitis vinifera]
MLQNITEPLKCHPQRISKDASCLLHCIISFLCWLSLDTMEKFKMTLNSPQRTTSWPLRQGCDCQCC